MALHPSQNLYYCRECEDRNPKYDLDFKCEVCHNLLWTKTDKQLEEDKDNDCTE